jgi:hypothetical protein
MSRPTTAAFRLTVDVVYDLNGECPNGLSSQIRRIVQQAASQGMLSGATEAEVRSCVIRLDRLPISTQPSCRDVFKSEAIKITT